MDVFTETIDELMFAISAKPVVSQVFSVGVYEQGFDNKISF
jgi:hypothetical protein